MKTLLLAALCLFSAFYPTEAHQRPKPRRAVTKGPTEILSPMSHYDKFKDKTIYSIGPMRVRTASGTILEIYVLYSFPGTEPPKPVPGELPERPYLTISSHSTHYLFDRNHDLTLLIDGRKMDSGEVFYISSYEPPYIVENMSMFPTKEALLKMGNAKTVECQLHIYEFRLEPRHQKALRDFVVLIP